MWWLAVGCAPEQDDKGPDGPQVTTSSSPDPEPPPTTPDTTPTVPDLVEDEFSPEILPADVLFVVDNSCSMSDDQARSAAQLPELFGSLLDSGTDFRAAFTTTDLDGNYRGSRGTLVQVGGARWLEPTSPDAADLFRTFVTVGINGSSTEQGIGAAFLALQPDAVDADFRRPDASLHVVVISDEPDLTRANLVTLAEFAEWFGEQTEPAANSFSAFADPTYGARYRDLALEFEGVLQAADQPDWTASVEALAELVAVVDPTLQLSGDAEPASVVVSRTRDGSTVTLVEGDDYTFDADLDQVVLVEEPGIGDRFTVGWSPR
jgi:hypothetical protein